MHKKKIEQYVQGEFLPGCEQKLKKEGSKMWDPCSGLGKSRLLSLLLSEVNIEYKVM